MDSQALQTVHIQARDVFPNPPTATTDCSAVYVGSRTLITAAHCVRKKPGKNVGNHMFFGAGVVNGIAQGGAHNQCYLWWYPNAWASSGETDYQYDFAVVDFITCPTAIPNVGWSGMWSNYAPYACRASGYPSPEYCYGTTSYSNLCRHDGGACSLNSYRIHGNIVDVTTGQSGGPFARWYGNPVQYQYVIGVSSHERSHYDPPFSWYDTNAARHLDTTFWNFIVAYSEY